MKFLALIVLTLGLTVKAVAADATATARLSIIQALTITNTSDLDFGEIVSGTTAAQTVAPGDAGAAGFTVAGEANRNYQITLPTTVTMNANNGPDQINVNAFTSSELGNQGTLDAAGDGTFTVGASTAALAGTEAVDTYTGNFTVTVAY